MKTIFTIKSTKLELTINGEQQVIKTPEIYTEFESSIGELKGLYELQKQALDESPAILEKFAYQIINAMASTLKHFEKVDEEVNGHIHREANIDKWFREYFLAPDTTQESKDKFCEYFNNHKYCKLAKGEVRRTDFYTMPFAEKEKFFNHICDTCF